MAIISSKLCALVRSILLSLIPPKHSIKILLSIRILKVHDEGNSLIDFTCFQITLFDDLILYLQLFKMRLPCSNLAECTVNTLINERQKGKQKMLWSRDGAHNILQIRASVFSKSWEQDWNKVEAELYHLAA